MPTKSKLWEKNYATSYKKFIKTDRCLRLMAKFPINLWYFVLGDSAGLVCRDDKINNDSFC